MKKLLFVCAFAFLFFAEMAFAAPFNDGTQGPECPTAGIANYTKNTGIQNGQFGCWTLSNVTADDGDTINVAIYYHNTSGATANNVTVRLTQSPSGTSPASSYTFSGSIDSSLGATPINPVTVNLSTPQTLTYGAMRWYADKDFNNPRALPGGQNGSEIMSGGLNIGSIAPGWATQGYIVVAFKVGASVNPPPVTNTCQIYNFNASTTSVQQNSPVTLSWSTNATNVNISGVGSFSGTGQTTVYPTASTSYTLTTSSGTNCTGSSSQTVHVNVNQQNQCVISNFTSSVTTVTQTNTPVTLNWHTNASSVNISGVGTFSGTGQTTIYPSHTTSYTLTTFGGNCINSDSRTIQVFVNQQDISVVTTIATNITQTSAQLNGLLLNPGGTSASVGFEYGVTAGLGNRTPMRNMGAGTSVPFSDFISGLAPNTTYFFRAIAQGPNGMVQGSINTFTTLGATPTVVTPPRQVIVTGVTRVGAESPIMLIIENRYELVRVGDIVDYVVTYKNIGSQRLSRVLLQVILPEHIDFRSSSQGTYDPNTRTLTVPLPDLNPGDGGQVFLQGVVVSVPPNRAHIVTTAVLIYTTPGGAQENAIAYELNLEDTSNRLGASVFFAGWFPNTLAEWLLLLILILLIILLTRRYVRRRTTTVHHTNTPPHIPH